MTFSRLYASLLQVWLNSHFFFFCGFFATRCLSSKLNGIWRDIAIKAKSYKAALLQIVNLH